LFFLLLQFLFLPSITDLLRVFRVEKISDTEQIS